MPNGSPPGKWIHSASVEQSAGTLVIEEYVEQADGDDGLDDVPDADTVAALQQVSPTSIAKCNTELRLVPMDRTPTALQRPRNQPVNRLVNLLVNRSKELVKC